MKKIFSPKTLRVTAIITLFLIILYLIFLLFPYLTPLGKVVNAIVIPFIISMIVAYLLHPLVDLLMKTGLNRILSILFIYVFFFGAIGLIIWFATPVFFQQLRELMDELPHIQNTLMNWIDQINDRIEKLPDGIHYGIDDAVMRIQSGSRHSISKIIEGAGGILDQIFAIIVIPFLVFYFLLDAEIMNKALYHLIPTSKRKIALDLWQDIDHSLGEYIRGQIIISVVVGVLSLIGYLIIGLPYSLFLSALMAIVNIIPYFGPIIGVAPAILIALLTKPSLVLWVILINLVIQVIEGNVLAPWIMGKRLHIHPVYIILALLIGHEVGGILGLILAVPIFVVVRVVLVHFIEYVRMERKQQSYED